jgi:hypothetical protein
MAAAEVELESPFVPRSCEKNSFMVREPHHERISGTKFQAVGRRPELRRSATAIFSQLPLCQRGNFSLRDF